MAAARTAIEAVGSAEATRAAAELLRPGGVLAAVGVHTEPRLALSPGEIYDRNLTYAPGRCPARHLLPAALARRNQARLAGLISHRLPFIGGVMPTGGSPGGRRGSARWCWCHDGRRRSGS